jgi:hypothetical protein
MNVPSAVLPEPFYVMRQKRQFNSENKAIINRTRKTQDAAFVLTLTEASNRATFATYVKERVKILPSV